MKSRRVDFFSNDADYECAVLGSMGFSTKCIIRHTKLRPGQITYRLKRAAIRRIDYRDGSSETATLVMRSMRTAIDKEVVDHLKQIFLQ